MFSERSTGFLRTIARDGGPQTVAFAVSEALSRLGAPEFRVVANELLEIAESCASSGCAELATWIARAVRREARTATQRWGNIGAFSDRHKKRARRFDEFNGVKVRASRLLCTG